MILKAYAKINLTLEVVGKTSDYHLLESIVVPVNLYDTLKFKKHPFDLVVSNVEIKDNNIYQAIKLFKETYKIKESVKVTLEKNIPIGFGLGGSSADISATLKGLNMLFNVNRPTEELEILANSLGSDTLYCLYNKRAFVYGRGDKIKFLDADKKLKFLIIYPKVNLLTKDVFNAYAKSESLKYIGFLNKDFEFVLNNYKNDLLIPACSLNEELKKIYEDLTKKGLNVSLSGSGSALFIVNPTKTEIRKTEEVLNNKVKFQIVEEI